MVSSLVITDPRFPADDWHTGQRSAANIACPYVGTSLLSSEMSELTQTNHAVLHAQNVRKYCTYLRE